MEKRRDTHMSLAPEDSSSAELLFERPSNAMSGTRHSVKSSAVMPPSCAADTGHVLTDHIAYRDARGACQRATRVKLVAPGTK